MKALTIRPCRDSDAAGLAVLYHRAVHEGAAQHYCPAQRAAWSPAPPNDDDWHRRLIEADTILAERDGNLLGFMTLDLVTGWLDFAYVAPEVMGQGVADTLYAVLEGHARVAGLGRLETGASLLGERFFRRHGWQLRLRHQIARDGVSLPHAMMLKDLTRQNSHAA
ncbi:GNAT family N-acetyltransferase [uncultured Roseicyclus sp.]|uniref:GNAT family N-acetyltransferase n=1 Tax=uncultured Roseicyclus sp. TaxID=543072 RepID=UPI002629D1ED|nr:GNAT family N-acetyltransferase [uncultured Roseicyclus sp.]